MQMNKEYKTRKSLAQMAKEEEISVCRIVKREYREVTEKSSMSLLYAITNNHKNVKHFVFVSLPSVFVFNEVYSVERQHHFFWMYDPFFFRCHFILFYWNSKPFAKNIFEFSVFNIKFWCIEVFLFVERVHLPTLWLTSFWLTAWTPKNKQQQQQKSIHHSVFEWTAHSVPTYTAQWIYPLNCYFSIVFRMSTFFSLYFLVSFCYFL